MCMLGDGGDQVEADRACATKAAAVSIIPLWRYAESVARSVSQQKPSGPEQTTPVSVVGSSTPLGRVAHPRVWPGQWWLQCDRR